MKAPTAFRTISEVASNLEVPQHVLRFWESKFQQIRPLKRGGGRRYYRPEDIALLGNIKELLYTQGMTIRGVQKLLREGGRPQFARAPGAAASTASSSSAMLNAPTAGTSTRAGLSSEKRRDLEAVLGELKALREFMHQAGI
ncbi:MAG: MerR family transcriptional regulator [Alphaproteobacteria bacterium]|nr:MerR family transcriptional regulator [Alphaproteobacteria bacterium]